MHILGQIRLKLPLASTIIKIYYLSHLASERNNSMICLAAILTEHYFLMAFSQMVKEMAHKKNKNEFNDFEEKAWFSKTLRFALKQVISLTKQIIRESCLQ